MMSRNHATLVSIAVLILTASIVVAAAEPDGPPVFEQQLLAGDPGDEAWFGENVAIEGDTIVVGARQEDLGTLPDEQNVGAVYVYTRTGGVWSQQQKIIPTLLPWEYGLSYGCSVDISSDTIVIGAYHWSNYQGYAEIYVRDGGVWTFQDRLFANPSTANSWYGFSTAIDGDSIIVGAFNATGAGSAHIYTRSGTAWTLEQAITAPVPDPADRFGVRVDIDGDTAAIGDNNSPGVAHVFTRTAGMWTIQQNLIPSDLNAEQFGFDLALDGDSLLIADRLADVDIAVDAGAAYVFTRTGVIWSEQQRLIASDPQQEAGFGRGLDIEGDTAVIAAFLYDLDGMIDAGKASVFREINGAWTEVGSFVASDTAVGAKFGIAAAMSGGTGVVGAYFYDHGGFTEAGAADVFLVSNIFIFADGFELGTTDNWDSVSP